MVGLGYSIQCRLLTMRKISNAHPPPYKNPTNIPVSTSLIKIFGQHPWLKTCLWVTTFPPEFPGLTNFLQVNYNHLTTFSQKITGYLLVRIKYLPVPAYSCPPLNPPY